MGGAIFVGGNSTLTITGTANFSNNQLPRGSSTIGKDIFLCSVNTVTGATAQAGAILNFDITGTTTIPNAIGGDSNTQFYSGSSTSITLEGGGVLQLLSGSAVGGAVPLTSYPSGNITINEGTLLANAYYVFSPSSTISIVTC
jgi:hypothetical protein